MYVYMYIQWSPYNADTLQNKRSVLIIGVSAFQRYGLYARTFKQSSSKPESIKIRRICKGRGGSLEYSTRIMSEDDSKVYLFALNFPMLKTPSKPLVQTICGTRQLLCCSCHLSEVAVQIREWPFSGS